MTDDDLIASAGWSVCCDDTGRHYEPYCTVHGAFWPEQSPHCDRMADWIRAARVGMTIQRDELRAIADRLNP